MSIINLTVEDKNRILELVLSTESSDQQIGVGLALEKGLTLDELSEIASEKVFSLTKKITIELNFGGNPNINKITRQYMKDILKETFKSVIKNEKD